jgi:hypothetical protein
MKTEAWWKLLFVVTLVQILFTVGLAFGFDTPAGVTDAQAQSALQLFVQNFVKGAWWPCLGPALVVAVWVFKKYDQNIPKYGAAISKFMDQPVVSFVLPFAFSAAAAFGTSMAAGMSFQEAAEPVAKIATEAITLFVGGKKVMEQFATAPTTPPPPMA